MIRPDSKGFYGTYGGAFIPELLYGAVEELRSGYEKIINSEPFQREYHAYLKDYVGRPTPLYFAEKLSERFKTKVFLKREDLCHTGAHKINNALGQALLARYMNKSRVIAETGAGQHGVATATACALLGIPCVVFMGEKDMERQALNVARMRMLGAEVRAVTSGSRTLKDATNEAIRNWISDPENTFYVIGSVVGPHPYPDMVALFQSVISREISVQLRSHGISKPDYVVACVGGGSNAVGAFYEFVGRTDVRLVGVEAAGEGLQAHKTAATLALGTPGILHGSYSYLLQDENGQICEAHSVSAGLDYPGVGPVHSYLKESGLCTYLSVTDHEALEAALFLARTEGIIPALETAHALAALFKMDFQPSECVVVNLSGRGDKDIQTYKQELSDRL